MRILLALSLSVLLLGSLAGCHTVKGRHVGTAVGAGAGAVAGYHIGKSLES